jgi:hypothetical protein
MLEEGAEDAGTMLEGAELLSRQAPEVRDVRWRGIEQRCLHHVIAAFFRVEVRGIWRIGGIEAMLRVSAGAEVPRRAADGGRASSEPSGWRSRAAP